MYIQTVDQLTDLVAQLRGSARLAIDTEFMRERSYYPQLEIIQVATPQIEAIIDYPSVGQLAPFDEILSAPETLKVFHSGQQDLEIFYNLLGQVPTPIFDTQVAAALVGMGAQVGYARLVEEVTGVTLQKSQTRTDWSRRPLSQSQLDYALNDVRYLLPIHDSLTRQLSTQGRLAWLDDEWESMAQSETYQRTPPQDAWQRVKGMHRLKGRRLALLQALADWREREAMRSNRATSFVVRDEVLIDLVHRPPDSVSALHDIRGLHPREIRRNGEALLAALVRGQQLPREQWPSLPRSRGLSSGEKALVSLMQSWLKARSDDTGIAASYLATTNELNELVQATPAQRRRLPLMQGWRARLVGNDLVALLEGRAALVWEPERGQIQLLDEGGG